MSPENLLSFRFLSLKYISENLVNFSKILDFSFYFVIIKLRKRLQYRTFILKEFSLCQT